MLLPAAMRWKVSTRHLIRQIAAEISCATRYYDRLIQWLPHASDRGELLEQIECPRKQRLAQGEPFPDLSDEREERSAVLLYANFNYDYDIQGMLMELAPRLSRTTRLLAVCFNPYLGGVFRLARRLGLSEAETPTSFVTRSALVNIARLSGFEVVRERPAAWFPFRLLGLGTWLCKLVSLLPFARNFAAIDIVFLRRVVGGGEHPSLSVVIPARNEEGNIEPALARLPAIEGAKVEVIFVEGHSQDATWQEIQRVCAKYAQRFECRSYQQSGIGKADAVRLGLERASGELCAILDADLTVPPEMLPRFYQAWCHGHADFVNGSRLVYPMEDRAMRGLNLLGNLFFAKVLSWIIGAPLSDVLCGTKLFARHDYARFRRWRETFGERDPFGDFELLFPAALLGLGIVDVPIRYRERRFGTTQIHRFRHGFELLRMTFLAVRAVKLARL
ncbi:MAG TPA: glycosyltransferase family 2 protein [Myxococcota bacterium]|nr:glycosyltransferase family 2 protein [Myxococcota bacterium]